MQLAGLALAIDCIVATNDLLARLKSAPAMNKSAIWIVKYGPGAEQAIDALKAVASTDADPQLRGYAAQAVTILNRSRARTRRNKDSSPQSPIVSSPK
jgi:Required for nuclear transport of RNA pol II C-terminus 2